MSTLILPVFVIEELALGLFKLADSMVLLVWDELLFCRELVLRGIVFIAEHHFLNLAQLRGKPAIHHVRLHLNLRYELLQKCTFVDSRIAQHLRNDLVVHLVLIILIILKLNDSEGILS